MASLLPVLGLHLLPCRGRDHSAHRGFLPSFSLRTTDIAVMSPSPAFRPAAGTLSTHPPPQAKCPRSFAEQREKHMCVFAEVGEHWRLGLKVGN